MAAQGTWYGSVNRLFKVQWRRYLVHLGENGGYVFAAVHSHRLYFSCADISDEQISMMSMLKIEPYCEKLWT